MSATETDRLLARNRMLFSLRRLNVHGAAALSTILSWDVWPVLASFGDDVARLTAERDRARAIAVALEQRLDDLAWQYAETVDGQWGCCCHSAREMRAGERVDYDGESWPIPNDCMGLKTYRSVNSEVANHA